MHAIETKTKISSQKENGKEEGVVNTANHTVAIENKNQF